MEVQGGFAEGLGQGGMGMADCGQIFRAGAELDGRGSLRNQIACRGPRM